MKGTGTKIEGVAVAPCVSRAPVVNGVYVEIGP